MKDDGPDEQEDGADDPSSHASASSGGRVGAVALRPDAHLEHGGDQDQDEGEERDGRAVARA